MSAGRPGDCAVAYRDDGADAPKGIWNTRDGFVPAMWRFHAPCLALWLFWVLLS